MDKLDNTHELEEKKNPATCKSQLNVIGSVHPLELLAHSVAGGCQKKLWREIS